MQGGHRAGQGTPRWVAEYLLPLASAGGREGAGRLRAQPARRWCLSTAAGARTRTRGRRSCPGGRMRRTRASPGDQLGSESSLCRCWQSLSTDGARSCVCQGVHTGCRPASALTRPPLGGPRSGRSSCSRATATCSRGWGSSPRCSACSMRQVQPAHTAGAWHPSRPRSSLNLRGAYRVAGQGGFPEPLTPEQQHQVRCVAGPQAAASTRACDAFTSSRDEAGACVAAHAA